jgi:hypothetical protein
MRGSVTGWPKGQGAVRQRVRFGRTGARTAHVPRVSYGRVLSTDLGSLEDTDAVAEVTGASGGQIHTHTHFTDNIIRLGLNYQFH